MAVQAARTLAQLTTQLRFVLKESSAANYDDSYVQEVLLKAYAEVWAHMAKIAPRRRVASTTMTYTSGSTFVNLPSAVRNRPIVSVRDVTQSSDFPIVLEYRPFDDLQKISSAQRVYLGANQQTTRFNRYYSLVGDQIQLYPPPGADVTLSIYYHAAPDDLSGGALHELPVEFEPLIYWGAARRLMKPDSEWTAILEDQYQQLYQALETHLGQWVRHGPNRIRRMRRSY